MITIQEPTKFYDVLYHIKYKDQVLLCTSYEYTPVFESQFNSVMRLYVDTVVTPIEIGITCDSANENRGICEDCKKIIHAEAPKYFSMDGGSSRDYSLCRLKNQGGYSGGCSKKIHQCQLWEINPDKQPQEIILDARDCVITTLTDKQRLYYFKYVPEEDYDGMVSNLTDVYRYQMDTDLKEWKEKYKSQFEPIEEVIPESIDPEPITEVIIEQKSKWDSLSPWKKILFGMGIIPRYKN